jgi:hypothetical protein
MAAHIEKKKRVHLSRVNTHENVCVKDFIYKNRIAANGLNKQCEMFTGVFLLWAKKGIHMFVVNKIFI